jgi:hypothetical protein
MCQCEWLVCYPNSHHSSDENQPTLLHRPLLQYYVGPFWNAFVTEASPPRELMLHVPDGHLDDHGENADAANVSAYYAPGVIADLPNPEHSNAEPKRH